MGQSENLTTSRYSEKLFGISESQNSNSDFDNIDMLNKAIGRYTFEFKELKDSEIARVEKSDFNHKKNVINIPSKLKNWHSPQNSKKFSRRTQSWQGIVIKKNETEFIAKLNDLSQGGTYEIGKFDMDEISPEDLQLLEEGAIFYWSVGHYMENGQSVKRSDLRFQRLILLNPEEFDDANELKTRFSNIKERKIATANAS